LTRNIYFLVVIVDDELKDEVLLTTSYVCWKDLKKITVTKRGSKTRSNLL